MNKFEKTITIISIGCITAILSNLTSFSGYGFYINLALSVFFLIFLRMLLAVVIKEGIFYLAGMLIGINSSMSNKLNIWQTVLSVFIAFYLTIFAFSIIRGQQFWQLGNKSYTKLLDGLSEKARLFAAPFLFASWGVLGAVLTFFIPQLTGLSRYFNSLMN